MRLEEIGHYAVAYYRDGTLVTDGTKSGHKVSRWDPGDFIELPAGERLEFIGLPDATGMEAPGAWA